jgi:peptidoglycan hydrolase-like protein with peptidoglycan-binding domain
MLVRNDPLLEATPDLVSEIQRRLASLGRLAQEPTGTYDEATRGAIETWAGEVNLEGRVRDDDLVSRYLLMSLRDITPEVS